MHHFWMICFLLGLALPVNAGGPWRIPWKKAATSTTASLGGLSNWQISAQLKKRVQTSFAQAVQAQEALPPGRQLMFGQPTYKAWNGKTSSTFIYPDKPFLKTNRQINNYMMARNNRIFVQQARRIRTLWDQIDQHVPDLRAAAAQTPQPAEPIPWLAQQIPTQTTLLFVGERHGYAEIRQATAQLLSALRQRYPQREILLFTEFLPEGSHLTARTDFDKLPFQQYVPVWDIALQNQIQVVGLDPKPVMNDSCWILSHNRNGSTQNISRWVLFEGVRLRNEVWKRILQQYRQAHPQALLVVYSGAGHSLYNYPFTLSTALPQEQVFVTAIYPDKNLSSTHGIFRELQDIPAKGPLELLTALEFPQRVLQFKDPALAKLAGFDIFVKLPINFKPTRIILPIRPVYFTK